jgi:AraC-like DNA-binding protein/mannose-6-phosphate isomerase-like protein (cupin superfamily)
MRWLAVTSAARRRGSRRFVSDPGRKSSGVAVMIFTEVPNMKDGPHDIISQKQVTHIPLGAYDFVIQYAEQLNEETIEFRNSHSAHEIYYILSGELTIDLEETKINMSRGDMLFIAPDVTHHVRHGPYVKTEYFALLFEFRPVKRSHHLVNSGVIECDEIARVLDGVESKGYFYVREHWEAEKLLDDIHAELRNRALGWSTVVNMAYFRFFVQAARKLSKTSGVEGEKNENLNLAIEASKYMHSHYAENITLQSVADYLHISSRHVNRVFRKTFGATFANTLRQLRFRYAKQYLSATDYSAEMITGMVGLNSVQSLRKLFIQYEGTTITQFKKSLRTDPEAQPPKPAPNN